MWTKSYQSPTVFGLNNILVVGSLDMDGTKTKSSNWSAKRVHVMAPSDEIPVYSGVLKG